MNDESRIQAIRDEMLHRNPGSQLEPLSNDELRSLNSRFPDIPDHLIEFFRVIGCGRVGQSRYMIYDLLSPDEIWDETTSAQLDGVFLIGDDFAGTHEAYHTTKNWEFGSISAGGRYEPYSDHRTFLDFAEDWFCKD